MTTASVTTDINIGPFMIPSNGQNMIMNNYAQRNNLVVEIVIPEPFQSNALATVQWLHHNDKKFNKVILCSIHQLPVKQASIDELLNNMEGVEFHFALEGIYGNSDKYEDNFGDSPKMPNSLDPKINTGRSVPGPGCI